MARVASAAPPRSFLAQSPATRGQRGRLVATGHLRADLGVGRAESSGVCRDRDRWSSPFAMGPPAVAPLPRLSSPLSLSQQGGGELPFAHTSFWSEGSLSSRSPGCSRGGRGGGAGGVGPIACAQSTGLGHGDTPLNAASTRPKARPGVPSRHPSPSSTTRGRRLGQGGPRSDVATHPFGFAAPEPGQSEPAARRDRPRLRRLSRAGALYAKEGLNRPPP